MGTSLASVGTPYQYYGKQGVVNTRNNPAVSHVYCRVVIINNF